MNLNSNLQRLMMLKLPIQRLITILFVFCAFAQARTPVFIKNSANLRIDKVEFVTNKVFSSADSTMQNFEIQKDTVLSNSTAYSVKMGLVLDLKRFYMRNSQSFTILIEVSWVDNRTKEVLKVTQFEEVLLIEKDDAKSWQIVELTDWTKENRLFEVMGINEQLQKLVKKIAREFRLVNSPGYFSTQGGN
jgi:hypothetical protein